MTKPFDSRAVALAPRHWLTREKGECAFPVAGDSVRLMSCCNPCDSGLYCEPHASAVRGPIAQPTEDLERDVIAWLERPR